MRSNAIFLVLASVLALSACGAQTNEAVSETPQPAAPTAEDFLDQAIAGDHRSDEEKARDGFRNPKATLQFFGVAPDMTVVEIWPGGGWYTNVIAPYLAKGDGVYYAASFDPARSERAAAAVAAFEEKFGDRALYGDVRSSVLGGDGAIAPDGAADVVLTFRNVHNWMGGGAAPTFFEKFYTALKPGGILGVVEHRADDPQTPIQTGYMTEDAVIALALAAGFELEARSEVNANAADTKDHPFGVWTLPPVRRSSAARGAPPAPDFDRAKYDAIGESDRMTLKFRKPTNAASEAG